MEQISEVVGNPISILIERIFWLVLGCFFGLSILTSLIKGLKERKNKTKSISAKDLENLGKKAIQRNSAIN